MSMRLRGASVADLEELGIDTTGMSQGKKSIVQQYKHMAGIDIMEGDRYKSTFQILDELHEKWETLSDAERAAITEATGGKRGGTVMASLMQNWEDARETVKTAESAMGSAMREHENYAMSVQYSIDRLHASLQTLAYDVINSGALKSGADFLNGLIQGFDRLVKSVDGLVPIMATLFGTFYGFHSIVGVIEKVAVVLEKVRLGYEAAAAAKATDAAANATELASEKALLATKIKEILLNHQLAESQAEETATELADALANTADAQTERLLAIEKVKTILANKGLAEAQAAETATEIVDTMTNIGNAGSEGAVGASKLGAALAALGPVGMGAIAALAALAGTAYMVYQRNEQLKNSASELAGEYNTSKKEIENYKEKIAELHETLNDSNTSYEDAKAARQELLGIQDELIEKYGSEAGSINVVTEAINGQVDALDKLTDRKWQQTVNEFNKSEGLNVWSDFWNQLVHGADDNMGVMEQEMTNATVRIRGVSIDDKEFLKQMEEALGGEYEVDMNSGILTFSGDLDEARDKLYQIQDIANNLNVSSGLKRSITDEINSVDNTLNKYREIYNQSVLYDDILPNYKDQYEQMLDAYEQYQNAIVDGNEKTVEAAKKNFGTVLNDINEAIKDDENKEHILDYFEDMYPELQEEIGKWKLEVKLNATTELDDDAKKDIYNQLANYSIGGNVDLTRRKPIDAKMLRDVGWEEAEGTATTYTSTYSNKAGTVAINFTPIFTKPNGEVDVLEPDALGEYAAGVIEGVHDDYLKLQIGAEFTGDNAIEQAVAAADEAHVLQEQYYLGERSNFNEAMSDIQQFANETELLAMQNDAVYQQATADQQLAWVRIKAEADNARMAVEDYISAVRSMGNGGLNTFDRSNNGVIGAGINNGATNDWERNNQSAMYSAMNSLESQDYNDLMLLSQDKLQQIRSDAQDLAKEMGVASLNTEQWVDLLQDAVNKEREAKVLAEDIEEVSFSFAGFASAKDELNNLGTLYKSIKEQMEKDPAKVTIDISEIEKLREKWSEALGGDEAFDVFEQKLASAATSAEEKISLLEDAATRFADSQFELNGATEETAAMVKSQLTEMGYLESSVDEYINARMRQAAIEREVNSVVEGNTSAINRVKELLRQEGMELGYTGQELENYINLMMQANGLSITGDASWLATLRNELQLTEKEIEYYLSIAKGLGMNAARNGANGMPTNVMQAASKNNTRLYDVQRSLKFDKDSAAWGSKSKGGGGGGGSKDAEKEKDILAELSKQLDEIQAAYSSLSEIVKSYNENGKLTID